MRGSESDSETGAELKVVVPGLIRALGHQPEIIIVYDGKSPDLPVVVNERVAKVQA